MSSLRYIKLKGWKRLALWCCNDYACLIIDGDRLTYNGKTIEEMINAMIAKGIKVPNRLDFNRISGDMKPSQREKYGEVVEQFCDDYNNLQQSRR